MNKAFKIERMGVRYILISKLPQKDRFDFCLSKSWWVGSLVLNGIALSADGPVTLTRHYWAQWSLTLDPDLPSTSHSSQTLSAFSLRNFNLQVYFWVIVTASTIAPDYCNLKPGKSHFSSNHTGPTCSAWMHCDKFRGLGFQKLF